LNCSHKNKTNAYGELMPMFVELVKHLKNKPQVDINRVKSLIIIKEVLFYMKTIYYSWKWAYSSWCPYLDTIVVN